MKNGTSTSVVVVIAAALMFSVTIAGAVLIALFGPEDSGVLIAQFFGSLAIGLPAVLGVAKAYEVSRKQEEIGAGVDKLRNGEMDSKLRAAVAEILAPHLIDPEALPQLEEDRAVRDRVEAETEHRP
jgi:hypothetical protein